MRRYTTEGKITHEGKLMLAPDKDYDNFLADNKSSRVSIMVTAISDVNPKMSEWYFMNVVIPKFAAGMTKVGYMYTKEQVVQFIKENCPVCWEDNMPDTRYFNEVIEWCKIYAAENLDTVIHDK